ncbi:protein PYRICULARIA ORYZAE RESISTANCE 21-like [Phragmites australis]|uniref:protein PYRICULARIA ORYZAE RESISTANCE 21-like n=1 Tax=Phragmites australis TaxID=29695 RepID=UPI002D7713C7|nr:protein PYRICULARIA ORYZAE RESISTANCE 21-like [Phragmites australis]
MTTAKDSTLIIEVDLACEKCHKKIEKVLFKLQSSAKENIRKIDFNNTKNTVTISGPFDPEKLCKKLRCKACEVIKDIKVVKPQEEKKTEAKKPDEKRPEEKKADDKKPEDKKPDDKKPADDKKSGDSKKPEDKKQGEEKPKDDAKTATAAAAPPPSSTTTVNLQFTHMCGICYPWPCSDPAHWGQKPPQWPCEGMAAAPSPAPGHHQNPQPPWVAAQKWAPCGGPSYCGGCGSCHGGMYGWAPPPQPMCCPGPSACRGCNGCRIVHESKFSYEEYPASACAIM